MPPLLIEWDPDSDIIGDFSWSGFGFELVARLNVAQALVQEFTGFRIESVQMVEPSVGLRRRKKKMVSLPYEGPELCELWIDRWFRLDEKASSLNLERVCGTCGFRFYTPKREGLVLERPTDAPAFFRLEQFPAWVFVSSEVKQHIEATGFTNVAFRDVT